jgi:ArsR family transcriptional regulator, arsenate/arsenite/antimonite-responsive transcriptional repressor / arsenate reductase (thioredoxin)
MYSPGVVPTFRPDKASPPRFLKLASHPLRWRLLGELARSDRRVGELCELAAQRQSLVSYHLRQLRDGELVSARRSVADGRDTYYVLDLARAGRSHPLLRGSSALVDHAVAHVGDEGGATHVQRL